MLQSLVIRGWTFYLALSDVAFAANMGGRPFDLPGIAKVSTTSTKLSNFD